MRALDRSSVAGLDRQEPSGVNRDPDPVDEMVVLEIESDDDPEMVVLDLDEEPATTTSGPDDGDELITLELDDEPVVDGPRRDYRTVARSRDVLVRLLVAGAVATLLSSQHLVNMAERMPFGTTRTVVLTAATTLDDAVAVFRLDAPDRWIRGATGRPLPVDPGRDDENLLASQPVTSETTPPTLPSTLPSSPSSSLAAGSTVPPGAGSAGPPTTAAETTTVPAGPPVRSVDPSDKLRVWAGGDSLGEYIGSRLLHPLATPELAEVELDYRISTGLTRPDFFNWQQQLWDVMHREKPPEALVFMVGGNDDQAMMVDGAVVSLGSDEWRAEYARRAAFVMDMAGLGNGRLYWVGLPPMRDAGRHEVARTINAVLAEEAAVRPWVTFVDIEQQFVGPDGNYSTSIADPTTGEPKVARADDGVHITLAGSTWIAEDVWAAIDDHWSLSAGPPPTSGAPVTTGAPPTAGPPTTGADAPGPPSVGPDPSG